MNPTRWIPIIDGSRRDAAASAWRLGLGMLTPVYRGAVAWRNRQFDRGRGVSRVAVPIISVGNLTTGGTGKTPFVIWLARHLRKPEWSPPHGLRVAIISRGYGAAAGKVNDEALEMEWMLPDVPHLQHRDRVRVAETAVEELESEVIIMDDGFQHRRLARDLDIVLVDATNPFGFDRLLPRGLLREPVSALKRADVVVLTRSESVSDADRERIESKVRRIAPRVVWAESTTEVSGLITADGQSIPVAEASARPTFAFAAIGNPAAFRQTLERIGISLTGFRAFPDHHRWTRDQLNELVREASASGAQALVCTRKDLVKIQTRRLGDLDLFAIAIEMQIRQGADAVLASISSAIRAGGQPSSFEIPEGAAQQTSLRTFSD